MSYISISCAIVFSVSELSMFSRPSTTPPPPESGLLVSWSGATLVAFLNRVEGGGLGSYLSQLPPPRARVHLHRDIFSQFHSYQPLPRYIFILHRGPRLPPELSAQLSETEGHRRDATHRLFSPSKEKRASAAFQGSRVWGSAHLSVNSQSRKDFLWYFV